VCNFDYPNKLDEGGVARRENIKIHRKRLGRCSDKRKNDIKADIKKMIRENLNKRFLSIM